MFIHSHSKNSSLATLSHLPLSSSTFYYSIRSLIRWNLNLRQQTILINGALLFDKLPYSMEIQFLLKIELESVNCNFFCFLRDFLLYLKSWALNCKSLPLVWALSSKRQPFDCTRTSVAFSNASRTNSVMSTTLAFSSLILTYFTLEDSNKNCKDNDNETQIIPPNTQIPGGAYSGKKGYGDMPLVRVPFLSSTSPR